MSDFAQCPRWLRNAVWEVGQSLPVYADSGYLRARLRFAHGPLAAVSRCSKLSYETGQWSIRGLRLTADERDRGVERSGLYGRNSPWGSFMPQKRMSRPRVTGPPRPSREPATTASQSLDRPPGPRRVRELRPIPASMRMVRPPRRTTTTFSAQSNASGGRNMSFSQAARTARSTLWPNIAVGSGAPHR